MDIGISLRPRPPPPPLAVPGSRKPGFLQDGLGGMDGGRRRFGVKARWRGTRGQIRPRGN